MCTTAGVLCFWDINSPFFDGMDVCWCLSQETPWILHETYPKHHEMMCRRHCHSQCSDCQNAYFVLFKLIKCPNLDINDAACLQGVHIQCCETVLLSDRFGYSGSQKTQPQPVPSRFVPNGSPNYVHEHSSNNLVFGIWNMQLQTAHLLVVSDFWYLQNSASCFEIIAIFCPKTRLLGYWLLRLEDIKNRRWPKDVPSGATSFMGQTLDSLIDMCGLNVMVPMNNRRFLIG